MRILQIHNSYQQRGGEDIVAENEAALLIAHGHETIRYLVSNDDIVSLHDRMKAALSVVWSADAKERLALEIASLQPDIAHVHNIFPLLTPSIYEACAEANVPVVQTLHNFRVACAAGSFLRKGNICEKCLHGSTAWGAWHRCYRGSLPGSVAVALSIAYHRLRDTWNTKVNRFIALTEFSRSKFVEAGIAAERIAIKPNFAIDPAQRQIVAASGSRTGALFVGRLSEEKGVGVLVEAWRNVRYPLNIIGDGPLYSELRRVAPSHVYFEGTLTHEEVLAQMAEAAFLVVPSICYEGFGMTIIEAYASGLPVLGSDIGSLKELIQDAVTGRLVPPGNASELANAANAIIADDETRIRLGAAARAKYEAQFTPEINYLALEEIYHNTIANNAII